MARKRQALTQKQVEARRLLLRRGTQYRQYKGLLALMKQRAQALDLLPKLVRDNIMWAANWLEISDDIVRMHLEFKEK